jgi:hypothetical protein
LGYFPSAFSEPYRPFIGMKGFSGLSAPLSGTAPKIFADEDEENPQGDQRKAVPLRQGPAGNGIGAN